MTAEDDIIEALHSTIEVELKLASIFIIELIRCLHSAHFVNPFRDSSETLIVCWQVGVVLQSWLDILERRHQLIHWLDVKGEHIAWCDELSGDIEDSLSQVSISLFTSVVGLASLEEGLGWLAMLNIVLVHEGVKACETLNRLLTKLVLMKESAELGVVLRSSDFAWGVCEFL